MVNKWSPGCNCDCEAGCPECTDYGDSVDYTVSGVTHGGPRGYANAVSYSNPTGGVRWVYWTGSDSFFNRSGSFILQPLSGVVPNRVSQNLSLSYTSQTISLWVSEIVSVGAPKPAESAFYEYEISLTIKASIFAYDDCGNREWSAVIGRVTPSTITPVSPTDTSIGFATITTPATISDWRSEALLTDCSYPVVLDHFDSLTPSLSVDFVNFSAVVDFEPTGGAMTLSLTL